jgi:hypothetical protein
MSSTEGMAFYHSPPLKIAVSALQREKHFRVNENLCEEVGIFRRQNYTIVPSQKMGSCVFVDAASSAKECLSACFDINITSSTLTNLVEKYCPHTSAAAP